ncbi:hypothetical protein [Xanthomonas phaseoli]|uniref:hypothetical protein n=1 Tax=Xanthomonas phaseoli TaxID=1985254 RepID=UPI001E5C8E66|nr:hypothetical protein [Xanthomonas phaseoli]MCC8471207.1 hypothetical protein [Xanthomonas phaseoli]
MIPSEPFNGTSKVVETWHVVIAFIVFSLLIAAYSDLIGLNMTPFRAESGLFIAQAWSHGDHFDFIKPLLTHARNGHYTPVFFILEFVQSGWFGADEQYWFIRQMLVLGLLSTSLYLLTHSALAPTSLHPRACAVIAGLVATAFVVQPTVLELTTWPFMAAQLLCLACGAMATSNLLNAIRTNHIKPLYWALAWGYASMHLFGVGFTISVTVIVATIACTWALRLPAKAYAAAAVSTIMTLMHAAIMAQSTEQATGERTVNLGDHVIRMGALYMGSLQGGARSLWANGRFPWPNPDTYATDAAYGYALLLAIVATSIALLWKGRREQKPRLVAYGLLSGIFAFSLGLYCALIVVRLQYSPGNTAINPFLFGTRYLIFPAFFIFLLSPLLLIPLAKSLGNWAILPVSAIGGGAAVATYVFFTTVTTLWPIFATPFSEKWSKVVEDARVQLKTSGFIQDRPLLELDPEFHAELHQFSGLLESELGCRDCVKFQDQDK